jgi:hypothetical protein
MNKWMRRTVGTVGIAGGIWLLGSGAAHADDAAAQQPAAEPQAGAAGAGGLLGNLLPADGAQQGGGSAGSSAGSSATDGPTSKLVPPGVLTLAPNQGQVALLPGPGSQVQGVLKGIPLSNVVPAKNLGGTQKSQPIANGAGTEALTGLPVLGSGLGGLPLAGDVTHGLPTGAAGDVLPLGGLGLGGQRTMHPMRPEAGLPLPGMDALGGAGGGLPLIGSLPLVGGLAGGGGGGQPSHAVNVMDDGSGSLAGSDSGANGDSDAASDDTTASSDTPAATDPSAASDSGASQSGAEHLPIFSSIPRVNGLV